MERVGEAVVSVLGLDESRYQDVLDYMTEEEMDQARRVQEEREAEYERVRSIREMRQREANGLIPMEEGSSISTTSGNNEPTQSAVADVDSVFVSLTENWNPQLMTITLWRDATCPKHRNISCFDIDNS